MHHDDKIKGVIVVDTSILGNLSFAIPEKIFQKTTMYSYTPPDYITVIFNKLSSLGIKILIPEVVLMEAVGRDRDWRETRRFRTLKLTNTFKIRENFLYKVTGSKYMDGAYPNIKITTTDNQEIKDYIENIKNAASEEGLSRKTNNLIANLRKHMGELDMMLTVKEKSSAYGGPIYFATNDKHALKTAVESLTTYDNYPVGGVTLEELIISLEKTGQLKQMGFKKSNNYYEHISDEIIEHLYFEIGMLNKNKLASIPKTGSAPVSDANSKSERIDKKPAPSFTDFLFGIIPPKEKSTHANRLNQSRGKNEKLGKTFIF